MIGAMAAVAAAASLYVAPAGRDADNRCADPANPCRTVQAATDAARPGQAVLLASGRYGDTAIAADGVRIAPVPGAHVRLGDLRVSGSDVEVQDLQTQTLHVAADAHDQTYTNMTMRNFEMYSDGSRAPRNISILGGSTGPSQNLNNIIGSNGTSTTASPTNILIDGLLVHDFTLRSNTDAHVDCLQVWAAQGLTIRNSTFRNCEVFDVFLQKLPDGAAATPSNILIENNFLDCCRTGFFSIRLADHPGTSWKDVTIRNNSTDKAINPDGGVPYANVRIVGNIGPKLDFFTGATGASGPKPAGITADYNVWYAGAKVGSHDQVAPAGYVNAAGLDFHLAPGAAAIDHGDPAGSPATDIDGQARPSGAAPDAGADERSDGPVVQPPGGGGSGDPGGGGGPGGGGPTSPPPGVRTLRFTAIADAALRRSAPRRRGGSAPRLAVGRGRAALLKFRVRGVGTGTVASARLRLWVARGSAGTLTVRRTSAAWKEKRASWRRSPKGGAKLGSARRVRKGRYVLIPIGPLGGDGRLGLRLSSRARHGVQIASRSRGKHAPRLELSVTGP